MMSKALEVLRDIKDCEGQPAPVYKRIDAAIQERIAQPEPEPKIVFRGLRLNGDSYPYEP